MLTTYRVLMATATLVTAMGMPVAEVRGEAGDSMVYFDMPPLAKAIKKGESSPAEPMFVTVELKLSSMLASPDMPRIDQWLVRCQPRDPALSIADYSPRTELASEIEGPIQIKNTNEKSKSFGLSIDGAYGHLARLHSGFDQGNKDIDSVQLDRVAPVHAVTASGTINRGRGVYFKLRWTAQQVLEGEKVFHVTLRVPPTWRGGLLDVSVVAQSEHKSFPGWDSDAKTLGAANFVVASYLEGDATAYAKAQQLFEAENELRILARELEDPGQLRMQHQAASIDCISSLLRHVATKLDVDSDLTRRHWIDRLIADRADPHLDKEIQKLPMPLRVAVLDYVDSRDEFCSLGRR